METVWRVLFSTCQERRLVKLEPGALRVAFVCKIVIKATGSIKGAVKTAPVPYL